MKHKYLHELFRGEGIPFPYGEEDYAEFDKRDTYCMDQTLIAWLYERLRYFQDEVSKHVITTDPMYIFGKEVIIDGKHVTQQECIDRMVEDCKIILLELDKIEENWDAAEAAKNDLFNVLSKVYWAMWW